jgi:hypothetical protein
VHKTALVISQKDFGTIILIRLYIEDQQDEGDVFSSPEKIQ